MLPEKSNEFTKENIDFYLKEVAKEYRKKGGKNTPAELVLIGGASVLINYGFRNITMDIDALIFAASAMKDAVNSIRDRYNLPNGWLNADFRNTSSYSAKLVQFSVYHKTYSNVMTIRTISGEYLIAMKLRSGRQYKNDLSDILGILAEHVRVGSPISMEQIHRAVIDLYGEWETLPKSSQTFIENVMEDGRFSELFKQIANGEKETRKLLIQFEKDYPGVMKSSNVNEIAENLQAKGDKATILSLVQEKNNGNHHSKTQRSNQE